MPLTHSPTLSALVTIVTERNAIFGFWAEESLSIRARRESECDTLSNKRRMD